AGTALSRVTGYIRLAAMGSALGIGLARTDAYNVANNTPNIIYELILGGVLTSVFVPLFVEWLTKRGAAAAWEAARSMLTVVLIVLTSMMVIAIVAAPWIVDVYIRAPGPQADAERRLATFFLRWFL